MDHIKELRIVKWIIIIMLVATPIVIGVHDYFYFLSHEEKPNFNTTSILSGFGEITPSNTMKDHSFSKNIYQNQDLGFQISKPNDSYIIRSMSEDLDNENMQELKAKGFLDGIYLNQNNNTLFMIAVFDIREKSSFELADYIDTQIKDMKANFDVDIPIRQVSPSNDWAIFGVHNHSEIQDSYGEEILYIENNKLYMLQYTGPSPSNMDPKLKSEYHFIIDSFEVLE